MDGMDGDGRRWTELDVIPVLGIFATLCPGGASDGGA